MSVYRRIIGRDPQGEPVREPCYTIKFLLHGKQRSYLTTATTEREALALQAKIKRDKTAEELNMTLDAIQSRKTCTVGHIIDDYLAAGCPDRRMSPRRKPKPEIRHLKTLAKWWSTKSALSCGIPECNAYHDYRLSSVTKGKGDRTTDLELVSLSNCFDWCVATGRMRSNPILHRPRYVDPHSVRHCRTVKPESGDELHRLANYFFDQGERSEVHGFLVLFLALSGQRPSEPLSLRWDAAAFGDRYEPGYMDGEFLYVHRFEKGSQSRVRAKPPIRLSDPDRPHVKTLLDSMRAWRALRTPHSALCNPYFFPGRAAQWDGHGPRPDPAPALARGSLEHAMRRACADLGLPPREPNGLRAYYVTTRRGQGISDGQIAYELGHVDCNPEHVRNVYGDIPANWRGLANVFTWLPNSASVPVAWERWLPAASVPSVISVPFSQAK